MKKILTILFILLGSSIICSADFVEKDRALEIAQRWFSTGEISIELSDSGTQYYVNCSNGGWMIISAEDSVTPILAYNDEGSLHESTIPSNTRAFIKDYEKGIQDAKTRKLKANSETKKLWKTAGYRTKATGGKLLSTAQWGQDYPYNTLCPQVREKGKDETALTGCVATCAAIVCRYYQWPEKGKGTIGGYSYTTDYRVKKTIDSYSIDNHSYNYDLMPMNTDSYKNKDQIKAVSQLMADLGVMAKAEYNYETGTGALQEDMQAAMFKHMGYSGYAYELYRNSCSSDAEFLKKIKAELDADRVVPYGGIDNQNGGHQFLCDGYDAKDYLHINWGWEGDANGYYAIDMENDGYTFNLQQSVTIGLIPDKEQNTTDGGGPLSLLSEYNGKGLTLSSTDFSGNFTVSVSSVWNANNNYAYSGKLRVVLSNYKGEVKEVLSDEVNKKLGSSELDAYSFTCNMSSEVEIGDRIMVQYQSKRGEWEYLYKEDSTNSILDAYSIIDTPYLRIEDSYTIGESLYMDIVPGNVAITSYTWSFDGNKQSHPSIVVTTAGQHIVKAQVKLKDKTTLNIQKIVTVK